MLNGLALLQCGECTAAAQHLYGAYTMYVVMAYIVMAYVVMAYIVMEVERC